MKFLILNFRNAGWFFRDVSKYDEKDFVFDLDGKIKRKDLNKQFKEPITVHQVSNMLHVLFGERPSPSLRRTYLKTIPEIKEMASNGWLKINDYFIESKKGNKQFFKETIRTKKSVWDSWDNNNSLLYWKRIEKFLGKDLYEEFLQLVVDVLKVDNPLDNTLEKTVKILHENFLDNDDVISFVEKLKKRKKTPLYNTIKLGKFKNTDFNAIPSTIMTTNGGITELVRLSGKIIVPIEDEMWINKMSNSQGIARILDGGFVTIDELVTEYLFSEESIVGFIKINEISDELIH